VSFERLGQQQGFTGRLQAICKAELPNTSSGQVGGNSLDGKIGNGACTLSLTNPNGKIEILKLAK